MDKLQCCMYRGLASASHLLEERLGGASIADRRDLGAGK